MKELPKLLSPKETAAALRVSPKSLDVWRCRKRYDLPYTKIGGRIFYLESDVVAFIERRTVGAAREDNAR